MRQLIGVGIELGEGHCFARSGIDYRQMVGSVGCVIAGIKLTKFVAHGLILVVGDSVNRTDLSHTYSAGLMASSSRWSSRPDCFNQIAPMSKMHAPPAVDHRMPIASPSEAMTNWPNGTEISRAMM
jgi:hypothetical protein